MVIDKGYGHTPIQRHNLKRPGKIKIDGQTECMLAAKHHGLTLESFYARVGTDEWVTELNPQTSQAYLIACYRVHGLIEAVGMELD